MDRFHVLHVSGSTLWRTGTIQNAVAGTGKFTDDCFIKAGEKIQEWVNNGYFPDGVNSLSEDDGQAKQLMYQETAGMLLCGSWYTGTFQTDSEEFYQKIGWFPFLQLMIPMLILQSRSVL